MPDTTATTPVCPELTKHRMRVEHLRANRDRLAGELDAADSKLAEAVEDRRRAVEQHNV